MGNLTAVVSIDRPARWGKQLASHLSHKAELTELENGWSLAIAGGTGLVLPGEDELTLVAEAADPESLERIRFVLEKHLRQFANKEELQINWV